MIAKAQEAAKEEELSIQVAYLEDAAKTIRDDAIVRARSQLSPVQREFELSLLLQRPEFFNRFKHHVAIGAANVIAANDGRAKAIYIFEESANPDAETEDYLPLDATIHLLLLVESNSAALEAFIASLDRAVTHCLRELPSPLLTGLNSVLDVIPITSEDVSNRRGHASLLSSLFARPIMIWSKDA